MRSIIPENVNVMALTATATKSTRHEIIKSLDMQKPVIVSVPPVKDNCVSDKSTITFSLGPICDRLAHQRTEMGRTVIFCRTYDEVTAIYYFFKQRLGFGFTDPPGAPDLTQFRLVDMYTHCTDQSVKDKILQQFTSSSPLPHVIVAIIAFGMGINCPSVWQIIHWGVPEDVETYVQETGRAGQDGLLSCALLFYGKGDLSKKRTSEHMRQYCMNLDKQCRKVMLFSDFDGCQNITTAGCQCCDICRKGCTCINCERNLNIFYFGHNNL